MCDEVQWAPAYLTPYFIFSAMAVGFWREFAEAEEAVGNKSGATGLRGLADQIAENVNQRLWSGDDHYVTQINEDGTKRDFVDYDSNFIAVAHGIPNYNRAKSIYSRIANGTCPTARGGWVSEYY